MQSNSTQYGLPLSDRSPEPLAQTGTLEAVKLLNIPTDLHDIERIQIERIQSAIDRVREERRLRLVKPKSRKRQGDAKKMCTVRFKVTCSNPN